MFPNIVFDVILNVNTQLPPPHVTHLFLPAYFFPVAWCIGRQTLVQPVEDWSCTDIGRSEAHQTGRETSEHFYSSGKYSGKPEICHRLFLFW